LNPIRSNLPPIVPPHGAPKPSEATRTAAQKAFFELALGKSPAVAAPVQASVAAAQVRPSTPLRPVVQAPAEPPARLSRPGSLLDIRV
jgi:hypothetical protein